MRITDKTYDEERALYGLKDAFVESCSFDGPNDGESPLKECDNIIVNNSFFNLRYPFWHVRKGIVRNCKFTDLSRAGFWYDYDITIENSEMLGIKAIRECKHVTINDTKIVSPEFCWRSQGILIERSTLESEYPFFECSNLRINALTMKGKYSFQYVNDMQIKNCNFDTKDAFWHAKDVTIIDSVIKGEYLGWYSDGLTFINCTIIGTQPLCYCKNLKLINCIMIDTDLSFERSEVDATINGHIESVKNPKCGHITASSIGQIYIDDDVVDRKKTRYTILMN